MSGVTYDRTSAPRRIAAALLVLVLMLAGVGQGWAAASEGRVVPGGGGPALKFPICHTGAGDGRAPDAPRQHACCDACALLALGIVPAPPLLWEPVAIAHAAAHAVALGPRPALARRRTPRQSQGPPAA